MNWIDRQQQQHHRRLLHLWKISFLRFRKKQCPFKENIHFEPNHKSFQIYCGAQYFSCSNLSFRSLFFPSPELFTIIGKFNWFGFGRLQAVSERHMRRARFISIKCCDANVVKCCVRSGTSTKINFLQPHATRSAIKLSMVYPPELWAQLETTITQKWHQRSGHVLSRFLTLIQRIGLVEVVESCLHVFKYKLYIHSMIVDGPV